MTDSELERLRLAVRNPGALVEIAVTGCAYSCCGRGWHRRDGHLQVYVGWIDNFAQAAPPADGTFMLYSPGVGTVSYVIAVRFAEVQAVGEPGELASLV